MKEHRCGTCNHLLFKGSVRLDAEVICPKCRRINYTGPENDMTRLRGKNFQTKAMEIICKNRDCGRLLFRLVGYGVIETKCPYCKTQHTYNTKKIAESKTDYQSFDRGKWGR